MGVTEQIAARAASKRAQELMAPLLSDADDDSSSEEDSSTNSLQSAKQTPIQKLKTVAVYLVLGGAVTASAACFAIAPSTLIFIAGGIAIANAPFSAYKEFRMSKIPTLRSMNNALREDANRLEGEVDILSGEIDILVPEANRAKEVEDQLRGIADKQSVNVNKLVELVKENETILAKMKDNLRQRIVQDIIAIVMSSDRDNDQAIDRKEGIMLSMKIRIQLHEYGVEFDSEKFLKVIEKNPTIPGVIAVVQRLLPTGDDVDVNEDKGYDCEHDPWMDNENDDNDELYDMFYVSEETEIARGAVAGARSNIQGGKAKRLSLTRNISQKSRRSTGRRTRRLSVGGLKTSRAPMMKQFGRFESL